MEIIKDNKKSITVLAILIILFIFGQYYISSNISHSNSLVLFMLLDTVHLQVIMMVFGIIFGNVTYKTSDTSLIKDNKKMFKLLISSIILYWIGLLLIMIDGRNNGWTLITKIVMLTSILLMFVSLAVLVIKSLYKMDRRRCEMIEDKSGLFTMEEVTIQYRVVVATGAIMFFNLILMME